MIPYTIPCAHHETSCEQGFRMAGWLGDMRTSYPITPAVSCVASWWDSLWWRTDYRNRQNSFQILPNKSSFLFFDPKKNLKNYLFVPRIANASRTCSCPATLMAWTLAQYVDLIPTKKVTIKKWKSESLIVFLTLLVPNGLHVYFASYGPEKWVTWSKKILRT